MSHLDWYVGLSEGHRERGYDLANFICPNPETVVEKIIPRAVEIACTNARKRNRRDELSSKHWKMLLTDAQLYQIGILEASRIHAKQCGDALNNGLIQYIGFLALYTLPKNSFHVAVGFERILNTGSVKEILELYEWLNDHICPDEPPNGRDEKATNAICGELHKALYREFGDTFRASGQRLVFETVPKGTDKIDGEICRILNRMIPWDSIHFEAAGRSRAETHRKMMSEILLAHVCIDQQQCLEEVKRAHKLISQSFDTWRVPIPTNHAPVDPSDKQPPRWPDVEEEIMREINWREEKAKRGWGSRFDVLLDGEIRHSIAKGESIRIFPPSFARYVEIRDAESKIMVANCHLMDPYDLPEAGWKSSVEDPAGGRVNFEFFPDQDGHEVVGLSIKIGINARRSWSASISNWAQWVLQPNAWSGGGRSLAWIAGAASLVLALSIGFIILLNSRSDLRTQVSHLQQENFDLRAQIPALETEVAELRKSQIQTSSPAPSEALYDPGLVALDKQGNLTGVGSLSSEFQQMIKTALVTGQVETPDLGALGGAAGELMGGSDRTETFALIGPVGVVVETDRPTLRWKALEGAESYAISVSDSAYNEVVAGNALSRTEWTVTGRLKRGRIYLWQVTAIKDGKEIKSPGAPGIMAKFQVLDSTKAADLAQAKASRPNSHLVMGLLYARAGLLDKAEREFSALVDANKNSTTARRLLAGVQALRRSR